MASGCSFTCIDYLQYLCHETGLCALLCMSSLPNAIYKIGLHSTFLHIRRMQKLSMLHVLTLFWLIVKLLWLIILQTAMITTTLFLKIRWQDRHHEPSFLSHGCQYLFQYSHLGMFYNLFYLVICLLSIDVYASYPM